MNVGKELVQKLKVEISAVLQRRKGRLTLEGLKARLSESVATAFVLSALHELEDEGAIQTDGESWELKTEK